jgi:hypothetical protein
VKTVNNLFLIYLYIMLFSLNVGEHLDPQPGFMAGKLGEWN